MFIPLERTGSLSQAHLSGACSYLGLRRQTSVNKWMEVKGAWLPKVMGAEGSTEISGVDGNKRYKAASSYR